MGCKLTTLRSRDTPTEPARHLSNHSSKKLEEIHKKKAGETTNTWRLKNILLKNKWVTQEIKEEIKKYIDTVYLEPLNTWKQSLQH